MSDFNATEQSQLQFSVRGAMQYFQAQWSLWKEGEIWERRRKFARGFIELPVVSEIWDLEVQQHIIAEEFIKTIESTSLEGKVFIGVKNLSCD